MPNSERCRAGVLKQKRWQSYRYPSFPSDLFFAANVLPSVIPKYRALAGLPSATAVGYGQAKRSGSASFGHLCHAPQESAEDGSTLVMGPPQPILRLTFLLKSGRERSLACVAAPFHLDLGRAVRCRLRALLDSRDPGKKSDGGLQPRERAAKFPVFNERVLRMGGRTLAVSDCVEGLVIGSASTPTPRTWRPIGKTTCIVTIHRVAARLACPREFWACLIVAGSTSSLSDSRSNSSRGTSV